MAAVALLENTFNASILCTYLGGHDVDALRELAWPNHTTFLTLHIPRSGTLGTFTRPR